MHLVGLSFALCRGSGHLACDRRHEIGFLSKICSDISEYIIVGVVGAADSGDGSGGGGYDGDECCVGLSVSETAITSALLFLLLAFLGGFSTFLGKWRI